MKKAYEPLNMIMNGRYAVLYGKLDPAIQKEVLSRMAELIEEERDYEDKGNYGHFCNILPTIAIDDVLLCNGKTPEEAFELISTHMWAALTPESFQKLSRLPFFLSVMRKIIPLGFKYGSGKGWKYVWHEDPEWELSFDMVKCPYHEKCIAYGCPELCRAYCEADDVCYGDMHPKLVWGRTKTLGKGGDCCDFKMKVKK